MLLTYEFKAKTNQLKQIEDVVLTCNPQYTGTDYQTDTYFHVPEGRLKLREGNIENALIHYFREDHTESKESQVMLYPYAGGNLRQILVTALGIKVVVRKKRKIYYIGNVKIHLDEVEYLGTFVEVEAINNNGSFNTGQLKEQCHFYAGLFDIKDEEYIAGSYSDLLLKS